MGVKKSINDAAIAAAADSGSRFDFPPYAETVVLKPDTADTYEILAAPAAGKVRRIGTNTRGYSGKIWNDSAGPSVTVHIQVGGTTVWETTIATQDYADVPNMVIPSGQIVELVLDDSEQIYAHFSWAEYDDTELGGAFISFDDSGPVAIVGTVPAGKIYVPLEGFFTIMNLDVDSHGIELSYYDGSDDCIIIKRDDTTYAAGAYETYEEGSVPPIMPGHSLRILAVVETDTTDQVAIIGWAILDEET